MGIVEYFEIKFKEKKKNIMCFNLSFNSKMQTISQKIKM